MSIAEKLTTIAENEQKVYESGQKSGYDNGYNEGKIEGYNEGKADGIRSEYDRFWDNYQNYGKRQSYMYAFCQNNWTLETFKPKYDLKVNGSAAGMFYQCKLNIDLADYLEQIGIQLNTEMVTVYNSTFNGTEFTRLEVINTTKSSYLSQLFYSSRKLVTIDKLILKDDGSQTQASLMLGLCNELQNLVIEGVLGDTASIKDSTKLTKASITSVINALSSSKTNKTLTLSEIAVTTAFGSTTSDEWLNLIATKSNWTISLV